MALNTIPEAIEDIKAGKMLVIVDDESRENEGDFAIAAEKVTPEAINFMAKEGRGLICMPIIAERLEELRIPMMVQDNTARFSTAFTVSIEAKHGVATGISAHDRAATIKAVIDPNTKASDIARPRPRPPPVITMVLPFRFMMNSPDALSCQTLWLLNDHKV